MTHASSSQSCVIAALYQFKHFPNYEDAQQGLQEVCAKGKVKGSLLIASEGINGTLAGPREGINGVIHYLRHTLGFEDLEYKESFSDTSPFLRMKVRLKKEIVTLGQPGLDPNKNVGTYVDPKDWNALISDPDVILVDTRNDYEVEIGTFKDAIDPKTKSFRDFPDFVKKNLDPKKNKRVAMCCTGGIRCEKSTGYLLSQGFEKVYHLKGGILNYFKEIPEAQSLWKGECFVFDERVSVDQNLAPGQYGLCHGCREPVTTADENSPLYERGVSCPRCHKHTTEDQKSRARERQHQIDLAAQHHRRHLGDGAQ